MAWNELPAGLFAELEAVVDRFEAAWQEGERPSIRNFCGSEEPLATAVLRELVLVDFEHRLRANEPRTANEYLCEFPELRNDESLISNLFKLESRWRSPAAHSQAAIGALKPAVEPAQEDTRRTASPDNTLAPLPRATKEDAARTGSQRQGADQAQRDDMDFGHYRILDENIGRGSFGTVHRAFDTKLGRVVAIKIAHKHILETELDRERFFREAQLAASLDHPNILRVHEIGGTSDQPFIVSNFIDGRTLEKELTQHKFDFGEAAEVVRTLADALHYAHGRGMTHRDVKPSNIMLAGERTPILMDFGMARRDGDPVLTAAGQLLGTPAYMSPEQAAGGAAIIDARSDVYSLGVVLYEMLCGERPFRGSVQSVLKQVSDDEPRPPWRIDPRIPPDLAEICLKCLHKEPADRYQNAVELSADLGRFLRGEMVGIRRISRLKRTWRKARKWPKTTIAIPAGSLTAVGLLVGALLVAHRAQLKRIEDRADQLASRGATYVHEGKLNQAIPYFAAAFEQSADPARKIVHRDRLFSSLEHLAQLTGIWGTVTSLGGVALSPKDPLLAASCTHPACVSLRHLDDPEHGETRLPLAKVPSVPVFSPNGKHLVVACAEGDLVIWNTNRWASPTVLKQGVIPSCLAIDPTSRLLASACQNEGVRIADLVKGKWILPITPASAAINDLAFSTDGLLAMAGEDKRVQFWDPASRKLRETSFSHESAVKKVRFTPNGKLVVSGCADGSLWVWNVATGRGQKVLSLGVPVAQIAVEASGNLVAAGWNDGTFKILSADSLQVISGGRHQDKIQFLEFAFQGKTLVTASSDFTASLWHTATGLPAFPAVCHGTTVDWAHASDDGQQILTADNRSLIWNWRLSPPYRAETQADRGGSVKHVELSRDAEWLLLTRAGGPTQVCDLAQPQLSAAEIVQGLGVKAAEILPDARTLVTASDRGDLGLWDLASQRPISELPRIVKDPVALHSSADGRLVMVCGKNGDVHVVSLAENKELFSVKHRGNLQWAFLSHNCQTLYTVGNRSIDVWNANTKAPLIRREELPEVDGCLLMPNKNAFLLRTNNSAIFCDPMSGEMGHPMSHGDALTHFALSSDEKWVLTTSNDKSAQVWNAATGERVGAALTHSLAVNWGAFSEDGLLVATSSADKTARVWDARTGEPVSPPLEHPAPVKFVDFRNHGKELVTVTDDGLIRLWRLDDDSSKHDLLLRARVTCGKEIDQQGLLNQLKPSEIKSAWDELNGSRRADSR